MRPFGSALPAALVSLSLFAVSALAQHNHGGHAPSPYAGEQDREIPSLSAEDIAEIERGAGWGMAKPAELNGVPGPAHLLELKDAIPLSTEQVAAIEAAFDRMRDRAIEAGGAFIAAERALDASFKEGGPDPRRLEALVADAAQKRAALRLAHLSAHLEMKAILSPEQIERYNILRGYTDASCATPPPGHDPAMWRKHNGCGS